MHRRRFLGSLAAGWALSGCRKAEPHKLVVAATPYLAMAPLHLALERKYFERAGFEIQLERLSGAGQGVAPMAGGKLDVSFISVNAALVNAIIRGARIRLVAGREHTRPDCSQIGGLLYRRKSFPHGLDSGESLKQLRGKRISAALKGTGTTSFLFEQILQGGGLTLDDVQLLSLDATAVPAALAQGLLDAALNSSSMETLPERYAAEIGHSGIAAKLFPDFQASFIVFGSRLLDGDPAIGRRFLSIYHGAVREYVRGAEPAFLTEYAQSRKLDLAALRKSCRTNVSLDGALDLKSIQTFLDWAARRRFTDRVLKAEEIVDTRFLEAARRSS